ncbi:MAG: hypothetical protein WCO28_01575 [Bacteroidota bacterium]
MKKPLTTFFCITMTLFFVMPAAFAQNKKIVKKVNTDFIKILDETGKNIPFVFKSKAKFEIQNGMLNIAVLSENNTLFEIRGISEKAIKDTLLGDDSFKMIYIISQNEKACVSNPMNSNSILNIKCSSTKKGSPIAITLQGNLFGGGKIIMLEAKLNGEIPEKKYNTTR